MKIPMLMLLCGALALAEDPLPEQNQKADGFSGKSFESKSFSFGNKEASSEFSKSYSTGEAYLTKTVNFGEKSFLIPNQPMGLKSYPVGTYSLVDKQPFSKLGSDLGNKASAMSGQKALGLDRGFEVKTYQGKENPRVQSEMKTIRETLGGMKDLPDRPLTIEEVKALVNKETRPASKSDKK